MIHNSLFMIHSRRGFTLIELVVSVAIIGILSTGLIAMINPSLQLKRTRDAQRRHDLTQIQNALEAYNTDKNVYPDATTDGKISVAPWGSAWQPYMKKVPKDPLSPTQDYNYKVAGDKSSYTLYTKIEACPDGQIPAENCNTEYNSSITSPNITAAPYPTFTPTPTPTNTPTPTPTPLPSRRVFVTSTTYNGNLGGLTGADAKCQARADAVTLGGTWKAWLATSTVNASTSTRIPNAEYRRVFDNIVIADNKADLTDGTLDNPINKSENNTTITTATNVWTGSTASGNPLSQRCSEWTTNSVTTYGGYGTSGSIGSPWAQDYNKECAYSSRLYCFEQ